MLERGGKIFICFLDVCKAFDTVWIDRLLFKLFKNKKKKGKMWLTNKNLHIDSSARVLYDDSLSRAFPVMQGTGQGRILTAVIYKEYINGLLTELNDHSFAIAIFKMD